MRRWRRPAWASARVAEMCARFGAALVMDALAALLDGAAAQLRAAVAALPDGEASAEGFMDSDGVELDRPVRFAVTVRVAKGEITFDFRHSDRQARGPVNLRPSMVEACVFYALIGALDPKLHFNDGMRRAVRFVYAPGTVVNASPPAPVELLSGRQSQAGRRDPRSAGGVLPAARRRQRRFERRAADFLEGQRQSMQYEILGSAYGGGCGNDGASALATHLSNLHITPIEILESEFPCRISAFELVPDSGGAGEFRGGLAFRRSYELMQDAVVVRRYDRARFPPSGVAGGRPGSRSRFVIRAGTPQEQETPASGRYELQAGERVFLQSAGGGGYGEPGKRDPGALARDISEGYVSKEAAARDYGSHDKSIAETPPSTNRLAP